jgi:glycosyltransferase involved in cell wall biosynthesis
VNAVLLSVRPAEGEGPSDLDALGVQRQIVEQPAWPALVRSFTAFATGEPLQVAYCWAPTLQRTVNATLERQPFDLLHVEHLRAAKYGMRVRGLPRIYDAVDCMSLLWKRAAGRGDLRGRILAAIELGRTQRFEASVVRAYDRVLITSSVDAAAISDLAPGVKPEVISNGVDTNYFGELAWRPQADTVIFLGIMRYRANEEAAVRFCRDVLPSIRRRHPQAKLLIVGSAPGPRIRGLAQDGLVTVTGYVPDIRPFLAAASVSVCPTSLGGGVQNKILESMAAGVPVVVSQVASRPLQLQHRIHALVATDEDEMAEHVCELLGRNSTARSLAEAGRTYVGEQFSWRAVGTQLESVYRELSRSRPPQAVVAEDRHQR